MSKVKKQHPIAWWDGEYGITQYEYEAGEDWIPLYEHPKINHKRVGLTDEQKQELIGNYFAEDWAQKAAEGLLHDYEAKLKEKNT